MVLNIMKLTIHIWKEKWVWGGSVGLGLVFFPYIFWRNCSLNGLRKEMGFRHLLHFPRSRNRVAAQELSAVLYRGSTLLCTCENNSTATKKCTFRGRISYLASFTDSEKLLNMNTQLCCDALNQIVRLWKARHLKTAPLAALLPFKSLSVRL